MKRLLLCLCVLASCAPAARPNVLLIVVDTLRADRLGWYGPNGNLTPFLDSLAAHGHVAWNAYAAVSWTSPSVASLWTSRYPSQHGITAFGSVLAASELTLAEILGQRGWATGGFTANPLLSTNLGYAQGFERYEAFPRDGTPTEGFWMTKGRAEEIQSAALAWLDGLGHGTHPARPVFLYLQYMETHFPYHPPEDIVPAALGRRGDPALAEQTGRDMFLTDAGKRRWAHPDKDALDFIEDLYDAEVMGLDRELRGFFAALDSRGFLANAIVLVTADHGEEFRDHEGLGHGSTLYNEVLRVPLLLVLPGEARRADLREAVSLVDVTPTLLDLLGVSAPPSVEGRSFAAALRPKSLRERLRDVVARPSPRAAYAELVTTSDGKPSTRHRHAIVVGSRKLIVNADGAAEGFELGTDPHEKAPRALAGDDEAVLRTALEHFARTLQAPSAHDRVDLDEATRRRLRALGYVDH